MPERERFVVELVALPHSAPAVHRLRRFLKAALRMYGLKCTDVRELREENHASENQEAAGPAARPTGD